MRNVMDLIKGDEGLRDRQGLDVSMYVMGYIFENFGTMAAATLNGRAKMRGLRYLKSCGQPPTAAVHGGKPLWTVALGALTGD